MSALFRLVDQLVKSIASSLRVLRLRLLFPNLRIKNCTVEKNCKISCGVDSTMVLENSFIAMGSFLLASDGGHLSIDQSLIGRNCTIISRKKIEIGKGCQIAEMVVIRDQNHNFGQAGKSLLEQGFSSEPISIGSNVWLAAKVTVLAGTTIGDNAVLAAHAVARNQIDANAVYGGIPAKKLRDFSA